MIILYIIFIYDRIYENGGNKLKICFFLLEYGFWFYDYLLRFKISDWKEKKNIERGIRKMKKKINICWCFYIVYLDKNKKCFK